MDKKRKWCYRGINLLGLNEMALRVDEDVVELDKQFMELSKETEQGLAKMGSLSKKKAQRDFLKSIS